jgi:hypothetical protein
MNRKAVIATRAEKPIAAGLVHPSALESWYMDRWTLETHVVGIVGEVGARMAVLSEGLRTVSIAIVKMSG